MNEFYWNNESWGSEYPPENFEEIIHAANREIDDFIERSELDPEYSDDYCDICEFSERLWAFYCQYGKLPAQAIEEDGFRVIPNTEIAAAVAEALDELGLEWKPISGYNQIIDNIDIGRNQIEEAIPEDPKIIQQYIKGFTAECEARKEMDD